MKPWKSSFRQTIGVWLGLFLFTLCFSGLAWGQPELGIEGGTLLGVGVEWISGSDWEKDIAARGMEAQNASDFLYGVFLRIPVFQWQNFLFGLRPEVHLMTPKGRASSTTASLEMYARVLHFPLTLEVRYPLMRIGTVFGYLGPSLNLFLTEVNSRMEGPGTLEEIAYTPYYGVVTGIVTGIGFDIPFHSFSMISEIRYTHTLTLVRRDHNATFGGVYVLIGGYVPLFRQ